MKIFILSFALFSSFATFGQSVAVFPNVINFGNSAQVQIYNSTEDEIHCSGSVTLHTQFNDIETNYYNDYIRSGQTSYSQMYYLMNNADRINYVNHFIHCYKVN